MEYSTIRGDRFGDLITVLSSGILTVPMAKHFLSVLYFDDLDSSPRDVNERNGWKVISNLENIVALCWSVVLDDEHASQRGQYKRKCFMLERL